MKLAKTLPEDSRFPKLSRSSAARITKMLAGDCSALIKESTDSCLLGSYAVPGACVRFPLNEKPIENATPKGVFYARADSADAAFSMPAGLVEAGSPDGVTVFARQRLRAASRLERVRRHEGRRALADFPATTGGSGPPHHRRHRGCLRQSDTRSRPFARLPVVAHQDRAIA
jgi:hypothetical protein